LPSWKRRAWKPQCYTKKVLVEESRSTPYRNLISQLLMRHADLYFNSK